MCISSILNLVMLASLWSLIHRNVTINPLLFQPSPPLAGHFCLLFAVLPVPILSRPVPSMNFPEVCERLSRIRFAGVHSPRILELVVANFRLVSVSDVCHWCASCGTWTRVRECLVALQCLYHVSCVRIVGVSWSSTPLVGSDMQHYVSCLLGLRVPRILWSCPSHPKSI